MIDPAFVRKVLALTDPSRRRGSDDPQRLGPAPGLLIVRQDRPTPNDPNMYEPSICLILQGRKELKLGTRELSMGSGDSVIVSHHLPLLASITEASSERPYVALVLELDLDLVRELRLEVEAVEGDARETRALEVAAAERSLIDAIERFVELGEHRVDGAVLGPMVWREIHYRLLVAEHGGTLRELARPQSHASQIDRALFQLNRDFAEPLSVAELARTAGMSASSFHRHFKTLTSTTPVQYQKSLRLLEARRLLAHGRHSVTDAALAVGYQSSTQFSREYSRHFGHAPRHDLAG